RSWPSRRSGAGSGGIPSSARGWPPETAAPALDETVEPPVPRAAMSPMTAGFAVTLAALGVVGAFIAGLVGVGGAVVLIPLLYYVPPWLGVGALDVKLVAGVTMGQVLAGSLRAA